MFSLSIDEEVQQVLDELCNAMQELFDRHKAAYGWEKKELLIK